MSVSETSNAALRSVILRAADDRHVRRLMSRYGMRLGAARFVAGETLDECVVVLRRLADQGLHMNTTLLGESVRDAAESEAVAEEYGRILERIHAEHLPCNVALKLTHLGLELDEELAYENVERVVQVAERLESFVRIDMEQSSVLDATLRIYRRLREAGHERVGTVLQSYLFRTEADLELLLPLRPNLRFVKGAYLESPEIAYRDKADVDAAYGRLDGASRTRAMVCAVRSVSGGSSACGGSRFDDEARGAIAAAVTPLRDRGGRLDDEAFGPYADFLVGAGLDGILAFGTNGEAVLLTVEERTRGLELWLDAVGGRALVAAHCGAQTTADTVALAAHARDAGADAVAVIGPPYFKLDPREQRAHLLAAAEACAPLPFYVYEFAATAGYAFDPSMLARLREEAGNVTGMKVSDTPWTAFERYLLDGFDVFVGPESLIHLGREAGAVGAVSALASAFPADVAAVVREPTEVGAERLAALRQRVESFPRHAALKRVIGRRGIPVRPDVRPPLRDLDTAEQASLESWLTEELGTAAA